MKKRLWYVLLAICVIVLTGSVALAQASNVASINGTEYATLQEAINEATSGSTITVLTNVEVTNGLTVDADDKITLDLNGHTVSMVRTGELTAYDQLIQNKGHLTIDDSSSAKNGALTYQYTGSTVSTGFAVTTITNKPGATLIVNAGMIENKTNTDHTKYAIDSLTNGSEGGKDTTLIVNGGTIKGTKVALRACLNSTEYSNVVEIYGGTLTGGYSGFQLHGTSSKATKANLTIEGGKFEGDNYSAYSYFMNADGSNIDVTIKSGEFSNALFLYNPTKGSSTSPFNVEILGGKYGEVYTYTKDVNGNNVAIKSIKGGTFVDTAAEAYLADDYGFIEFMNNGKTFYRVGKAHKVSISIPEGATIVVSDKDNEDNIMIHEAPNGSYKLMDGEYAYTVEKDGYVSKKGSFEVNGEDLEFTVTLNPKVNAQMPEITVQPAAVTCMQGETVQLNVNATVNDGGMLSYQWYSITSNGDNAITGATENAYKPSTAAIGTADYYCIVTNTNANATGLLTATQKSNTVTVTVEEFVSTHVADITVIGQIGASYTNVHATLMPLGENEAAVEDKPLTYVEGSSPAKYVYHETVKDGMYNLIIEATEEGTDKTVTVTTLVDLDGKDDSHTVDLPEAEKSSLVEDKTDLGIIVGNVEKIAKEQEPENEGGHLEVKLTVNEVNDPSTSDEDEAHIEQKADQEGKEIEKFLDIDLTLLQYDAQGKQTSQDSLGNTNTQLLQIIVPIDNAENRKIEGFDVYRIHNDELQTLPHGNGKDGKECFEVNLKNSFITIYARHFSYYAIAYGEKVKPEILMPTVAQTVTVTEGETATMSIVAKDAVSYQWQINFNDGTGWHVRGENKASYTSSPTTLDNNGYQYKCVVTSSDNLKVESPIFTLNVVKKVVPPQTGDDSHIGLWVALCLISFVGMITVAMNGKKRATK